MAARGPIRLVSDNPLSRNLFERAETGDHLARLRQCDGSPDERADARRDLHQPFVKQGYFRPVYISADRPPCVDRLNGRLQLVTAHALEFRG